MRSYALASLVLAILAVSSTTDAQSRTPQPAKPKSPPASLPALEILPSVARVKVTTYGKNALSVIEEVNLPRGAWRGEPLDFHVAFGAPGPRAVDAHLVAVGDGELEPDDDDTGEVVATERVPRRPSNAYALLGRETMAGVVVHLREAALTKAFAKGNMASLRIRSLVETTDDAEGASSVVVRLGASRGTPLTLGRIAAFTAEGSPPLVRAEAKLCGPEADPHPLAVGAHPKLPNDGGAIAPVLAVRHASDDLCLRLWTRAQP